MSKYLIPLVLLVAACGTTSQVRPEPIIVPQPVAVGVDAPCVPEDFRLGRDYADDNADLRSAADAAVRYQLLWAGRAQRQAYINELETVVRGCPRGRSSPQE